MKDLGVTTGPPWERRFECKLALLDSAPELRPGMSARIVVTLETLKNVNWLPAQALFEQAVTHMIYAPTGSLCGTRREAESRGESRVVVEACNRMRRSRLRVRIRRTRRILVRPVERRLPLAAMEGLVNDAGNAT